jgi:hypothetical protein
MLSRELNKETIGLILTTNLNMKRLWQNLTKDLSGMRKIEKKNMLRPFSNEPKCLTRNSDWWQDFSLLIPITEKKWPVFNRKSGPDELSSSYCRVQM